jgi:hypothetical protein
MADEKSNDRYLVVKVIGCLKREADGGTPDHDDARVRRIVLAHVTKKSGKSEFFKSSCKKEKIKYFCELVKRILSPINMNMKETNFII